MKMSNHTIVCAGIDTGKRKLDAAIGPGAGELQVANTPDGHAALSAWLYRHQGERVGIEATGEGREAWVWRGMDILDLAGGGTVGDQGRIDPVVLGPLEMEAGIGPDLCGLEDDDSEAVSAQPDDDLMLAAASRLDADPFDLVPV